MSEDVVLDDAVIQTGKMEDALDLNFPGRSVIISLELTIGLYVVGLG